MIFGLRGDLLGLLKGKVPKAQERGAQQYFACSPMEACRPAEQRRVVVTLADFEGNRVLIAGSAAEFQRLADRVRRESLLASSIQRGG